jgi:hypothetical protein
VLDVVEIVADVGACLLQRIDVARNPLTWAHPMRSYAMAMQILLDRLAIEAGRQPSLRLHAGAVRPATCRRAPNLLASLTLLVQYAHTVTSCIRRLAYIMMLARNLQRFFFETGFSYS